MRLVQSLKLLLIAGGSVVVTGFTGQVGLFGVQQQQQQAKPHLQHESHLYQAAADTAAASAAASSSSSSTTKTKTLGLLTFDLDDTLYPIDVVIKEANVAFAKAMERFGFAGIEPEAIDNLCKEIRRESDQESEYLTHTQVREVAIRREMEKVVYERKLKETADDWATQVTDLADLVTRNAKKWAHAAVSDSIVSAVLTAWEMERHHAAERNLFPEVVEVLKEIRQTHPHVIIGAVTDGKANPMLMTFTLEPYFDFSMSWEDDQAERQQFFQELGSVEGRAQLTWIYTAALEKYNQLASAKAAMTNQPMEDDENEKEEEERVPTAVLEDEDKVWVHVGDDLFYDVGGSASCGAKTVLVDLAEKYGQTAPDRFDLDAESQPAWSTSTIKELEIRRVRNEESKSQVDQTVAFLTLLPEAIERILQDEQEQANAVVADETPNNSSVGMSP